MKTRFLGTFVAAGLNDPSRVLLFDSDPGDSVCQEVVLDDEQRAILDLITQIDGVGNLLLLYAGAGVKVGMSLPKGVKAE